MPASIFPAVSFALLSSAALAADGSASAAVDGDAAPPAVVADAGLESYAYEFGFKEIFGKSKHRVGAYAKVEHTVGPVSTRTDGARNGYEWRSRRDLRLEIAATGEATLLLEARLVERGFAEDHNTLLGEVFEEIIGMQLGWEEQIYRKATGTLSSSLEPDTVWNFAMEMQDTQDNPDSAVAQLTLGDRTLHFLERPCTSHSACVDAYEDGDWLAAGDQREYRFKADIDPTRKLLLLGGMEAFKIAAKFHDSIH